MKNSVYLQLALIAGSLILLVFLVVNQQPPVETTTAIVLRDGDQEIEVLPKEGGDDAEPGLSASANDTTGSAVIARSARPSVAAPAGAPRPRKRPINPDAVAQPPAATAGQSVPEAAAPPPDETTMRRNLQRQLGIAPIEAEPAAETKF